MRGPMMISGQWHAERARSRAERAAMLSALPGMGQHGAAEESGLVRMGLRARKIVSHSMAACGFLGGGGECDKPYAMVGTTAIIAICGELYHGCDFFEWLMGNTSYQDVRTAVLAAKDDDTVERVWLDVSSPGGMCMGWIELADAVKELAAKKTVIAGAHDLMASAALGSCIDATRIVATPTARVGSVGAIVVVTDSAEMYAELGIKPVVVTDAPLKSLGIPGVPIDDAMRAELAVSNNAYAEQFRARVEAARGGRGATAAEMLKLKGAVLPPKEAIAAGLVDEVWDMARLTAWLNGEFSIDDGGGAGRPDAVDEPGAPPMEDPMDPKMLKDLTADQLGQARPDLVETLKLAGRAEAAEKPATLAQLKAAFPGDDLAAFRESQIEAGATLTAARLAMADRHEKALKNFEQTAAAERAEHSKALKEATDRAAAAEAKLASKAPTGQPGAGGVPFEGDPASGGSAKDYIAMVNAKADDIEKMDKVDRITAVARAHASVRRSHPEAHEKYEASLIERAQKRQRA